MIMRKYKVKRAFTLIELMVTIVAAIVLIIGISAMIAQGHRGYNRLYKRVTSEVVRNAYEARVVFDAIVRKSSIKRCDFSNGNNTVYLYYFSNPQDLTIEDPDRYARFYLSGTDLMLDHGEVTGGFETPQPGLPSLSPTGTKVLARNLTVPEAGIFSMQGAAVRMVLTLDNNSDTINKIETLKMTVTTTAIRHNQ